MPSMGLGLGLVRSGGAGAGLNFSALTALPSGRQSAVTTAANAAAANLSVTPQSIIDDLSLGRGLASLLPNDGCLLASSGGAVTVQGDPVGAIRSWTGVELATQSNASLRPVSAAGGLYADGTRRMNFTAFTGATEAEGIGVLRMDNSPIAGTANDGGVLWHLSNDILTSAYPFSDGKVYTNFFRSTRFSSTLTRSPTNTLYIVNEQSSSSGLNSFINQVQFVAGGSSFAVPTTPSFLSSNQDNWRLLGTVPGIALNSVLYTANQRAAVHEFCKAYYGVTY